MTVLEHLSAALLLDRMERANSPVSLHIQNALNTFGRIGQDEIRKANQARQNRTATSTAKPAAQDPRSWNPAESLGKFQGLPTSEVIQSSPQVSKPVPVSPPSGKQSVPVVGTDFQDLAAATEIPKRPTKVLEAYGIEQIKMYLELVRVEIPEDANDKEIAALLIQNFKPGK